MTTTTSPATVPQEARPAQVGEILRNTTPAAIPELDFVRSKFITNYNATHKGQNGELVYHRQLLHVKQLIAASQPLQLCDPFSIYACFVTAAVQGWSLDPQDNECYLVPLKGKAVLWPQTPAKVRRILESQQAKFFDQARLVYAGDLLEVENGRVVRHVEKFESEKIVAGYVRVVIDDTGADRFFIYRPSDWNNWKKKSQQASGDNWSGGSDGQPLAGFLRTKIISHACGERCWAAGKTDPTVEAYAVVVEDPEFDAAAALPETTAAASAPAPVVSAPAPTATAPAPAPQPSAAVVVEERPVGVNSPAFNNAVKEEAKAATIAALPDQLAKAPSVIIPDDDY